MALVAVQVVQVETVVDRQVTIETETVVVVGFWVLVVAEEHVTAIAVLTMVVLVVVAVLWVQVEMALLIAEHIVTQPLVVATAQWVAVVVETISQAIVVH